MPRRPGAAITAYGKPLAAATVAVAGLPLGALVEIEVIVELP